MDRIESTVDPQTSRTTEDSVSLDAVNYLENILELDPPSGSDRTNESSEKVGFPILEGTLEQSVVENDISLNNKNKNSLGNETQNDNTNDAHYNTNFIPQETSSQFIIEHQKEKNFDDDTEVLEVNELQQDSGLETKDDSSSDIVFVGESFDEAYVNSRKRDRELIILDDDLSSQKDVVDSDSEIEFVNELSDHQAYNTVNNEIESIDGTLFNKLPQHAFDSDDSNKIRTKATTLEGLDDEQIDSIISEKNKWDKAPFNGSKYSLYELGREEKRRRLEFRKFSEGSSKVDFSKFNQYGKDEKDEYEYKNEVDDDNSDIEVMFESYPDYSQTPHGSGLPPVIPNTQSAIILGRNVSSLPPPSFGSQIFGNAMVLQEQQSIQTIFDDLMGLNNERMETPEGFASDFSLLEHQKVGLSWMNKMELSKYKGGILADDMGLGKTIQTISIMLQSENRTDFCDGKAHPTLIVAPVALINQWREEIDEKTNRRLRILVNYGNGREKYPNFNNYDVVITSYTILVGEWPKLSHEEEEEAIYANSLIRRRAGAMFRYNWYRVVLDEAHTIKNRLTRASRSCRCLLADYRWCLTGTPIQNKVDDLYSLVRFLRIDPYQDYGSFKRSFTFVENNGRSMKSLRAFLLMICLRRTKHSKIDDKPIIEIPNKDIYLDSGDFDHEPERNFYKALESKTTLLFNQYLKSNTVMKNYSNILVLLLLLREACCHPILVLNTYDSDNSASQGRRNKFCRNFIQFNNLESREKILDGIRQGNTCGICNDIPLSSHILSNCYHRFCEQCIDTYISDRTPEMRQNELVELRCPVCRVQFKCPDNIIPESEFMRHFGETSDLLTSARESVSSNNLTNIESFDISRPNAQNRFISSLVANASKKYFEHTRDNNVISSQSNNNINLTDNVELDDDSDNILKNNIITENAGPSTIDQKSNILDLSKPFQSHITEVDNHIEDIKKFNQFDIDETKYLINQVQQNGEPYPETIMIRNKPFSTHDLSSSTKIDKCLKIVENVINTTNDKILIFSQFLGMIDLVQFFLKVKLNQKTLRYDGSLDSKEREKVISKFKDTSESSCRILCISLKAGGLGLNLTCANHVIMLDFWWNPAVENQAIDRAHRLGQRKKVKVYRIAIKETVEDRILGLQKKKQKLFDEAFSEGGSGSLGRLDITDLRMLFGV